MGFSRTVRLCFAGLGVFLFAFLVWKAGPARLVENIYFLGWGLLGTILLDGLSNVVKTWAWRFNFAREHRTVPFLRMLAVRLAGEAAGQLSFGPLAGETTRALMIRSDLPVVNGISSVALDRGMYSFTGALLIVIGVVLSLFKLSLSPAVQSYGAVIALGVAGFVFLTVIAIRRRWAVLSAVQQVLGRIGVNKRLTEKHQESVRKIEALLHSFYQESPISFWFSFGLNLLGHAFGVLEVYLLLWFLGLQPTLLIAFLVEVLTKVVNIARAVIPANLGVYEAGNVIILSALGLGRAAGLTVGVARRLRSLFWAGVGLGILLLSGLPARRLAGADAAD